MFNSGDKIRSVSPQILEHSKWPMICTIPSDAIGDTNFSNKHNLSCVYTLWETNMTMKVSKVTKSPSKVLLMFKFTPWKVLDLEPQQLQPRS